MVWEPQAIGVAYFINSAEATQGMYPAAHRARACCHSIFVGSGHRLTNHPAVGSTPRWFCVSVYDQGQSKKKKNGRMRMRYYELALYYMDTSLFMILRVLLNTTGHGLTCFAMFVGKISLMSSCSIFPLHVHSMRSCVKKCTAAT